MVREITMPQLGESVTEGTISKWLVKPGDKVNKYEPIAEVMTDKVNAEIPSSYTGIMKKLIVAEDETVKVGTAICTIDAEELGQTGVPLENNEAIFTVSEEKEEQTEKRRYSPAVLRLAQENNLDLEQVRGTGKGGRITRKDVLAFVENESVADNVSAHSEQRMDNRTSKTRAVSAENDTVIPVSNVRKVIATNMVRSKQEIPHAWTMVEVDVTNLVNYRNSIKEQFKQREGFSITFLPFFIKAIVEALREYPQLNSMWAGEKIIQKKEINISLAVGTDALLYVPVIKHADEKSINGIAKEVQQLVEKVQTGKISAAEMQGGTFTVNNTGSFGSILSAPIINYPQAAILSIESIVKRPVVIDDMIAIRSMVNLCLSIDHRILDGIVCGRFLAKVKERLEGMTKETVSIY